MLKLSIRNPDYKIDHARGHTFVTAQLLRPNQEES